MPRERSPNRQLAFEMWRNSDGKMLLKEIAAELTVSDSQIRKWKNQDKWNERLKGNVTKPKGNVTKRVSGAPKGNKNAVGNLGGSGGPAGNKKAVVTGEHETIWMDALDIEERVLFHTVNTDVIAQIEQEIRLLEIRERRMLLRIQLLQAGPEMVVSDTSESEQDNPQFGTGTSKTKNSEASVDRIQRIEEALTRVQDKKAKMIELRHKIDVADKPDGSDGGNIDQLTEALEKSAEKFRSD